MGLSVQAQSGMPSMRNSAMRSSTGNIHRSGPMRSSAMRSSTGNIHRSGQHKPRVIVNDVLAAVNSETFTFIICLREAKFRGYRDDAEETSPSTFAHNFARSCLCVCVLISLLCLSFMLRK